MAKKTIYGPKCGKALSVEETESHVFCMHCGNSIDIILSKVEEMLDVDSSKDAEVPESVSKKSTSD